MNSFFAAFIIIMFSFSALAIGLIMRNKPITGSCGGVMNSDTGQCDICGKTDISSCNNS
jgi:hypothetical protein